MRQVIGLALVLGLIFPGWLRAAQLPPAPSSLQIATMPAALRFDLRRPSSLQLEVQVRDPQGRPVRRAIVVFLLPGSGASAYFLNSGRMETVMTDDNGVARVTLTRAANAGNWAVTVQVQYNGLRGEVTVPAQNVAGIVPAVKWGAIGGVAAGGAVAAVILLKHSGPGPTMPNLTTITAGAATIR